MAFDAFQEELRGEGALVAGVLSGTSADGIDVGIARFRAAAGSGAPPPRLDAPELVVFEVVPFDADLHARVRALLDGAATSLRDVALLHRDLGRAFGRAARDVARAHALRLAAVGSHGQTVWHHDGAEASGAATLQLGDGDFVAEECGAPVVSDFRQRDVAAGGEGAPLSALADDLVFARAPRPLCVLNLGGMANVTWLPERGDPLAFDTGPAGSLLDGLARALFDRPYDEGGAAAAAGRADERLVEHALAHPFFARRAPKSTGRDTFGAAYVEAFAEAARARRVTRPEDVLASGVAVVAEAVARALADLAPERPRAIVVAGGGAANPELVRRISERARTPVHPSSVHGVEPKAREALVFAVLAARFLAGAPVTCPSVTGARAGRLLGKLSPPPQGLPA